MAILIRASPDGLVQMTLPCGVRAPAGQLCLIELATGMALAPLKRQLDTPVLVG